MEISSILAAVSILNDKRSFSLGTLKCYVERSSLFFLFMLALSCTSSVHKVDFKKVNDPIVESKQVSANKSPDTVPADFLIVPGQSVGKIHLNTNAEIVYRLLGTANAGDAAMGKSIATWFFDQDITNTFSIYTSRDLAVDNPPALIREIRVTASKFQTADGFGPGSSIELAQNKYKLEPAQEYKVGKDSISLYFDRSGIGFEFYKNGSCRGILIYPGGVLSPNNYLKFIP
jgi:hypothetical protein